MISNLFFPLYKKNCDLDEEKDYEGEEKALNPNC